MVIVDSSVWIDFLRAIRNRHTVWLDAALGNGQIGLTSLILCEVLQGTRADADFEQSRQLLLSLPVYETVSVKLAIAAAQNFRLLRQQGITVRSVSDCLIATFCIHEGFQLLHRDRDFNAFQTHLGLQVLIPPIMFPN